MKNHTPEDSLTNKELQIADARGQTLAQRVIVRYGTADVFEIARRANVRVVYERWPLVTVGECEPRLNVVRINLAALDQADEANDADFSRTMLTSIILAHELGHLFDERLPDGERKKPVKRVMSERTAHAFAARLLKFSPSHVEYERRRQKKL